MESEFWTSTLGKTVRWIIFLPAAALAALLAGSLGLLFNLIFNSGSSAQWAYVAAAVVSFYTFLGVVDYLLPSQKKIVLYISFALRIVLSVVWFVSWFTNPEDLHLNLAMLIIQEVMVLGSGWYLINHLLSDE